MNRNNPRAIELAKIMSGAGVAFGGRPPTARTIESMSHLHLEPLPTATPGQVATHARLLYSLGYGPGCKAPDHIALVLLANGCPCDRARDAIWRAWSGGEDDLEDVLGGRSSADVISVVGEAIRSDPRTAATVVMGGLSATIGAVAQVIKMLTGMTVTGGRTDYAGAIIGPLEETPESRKLALANMVVQSIAGESLDDPSPLADTWSISSAESRNSGHELDPEEDAVFRDMAKRFTAYQGLWLEILRSSPLDELSRAAQAAREMMVAPMLTLTGMKASDEEIDRGSAVFAPIFLSLQAVQQLREMTYIEKVSPEEVAPVMRE